MSECYMGAAGKNIENATTEFYYYGGGTKDIAIDTKGFYVYSGFNYGAYYNFQSGYMLSGFIKDGVLTILASDCVGTSVTYTAGVLRINNANSQQIHITVAKINQ